MTCAYFNGIASNPQSPIPNPSNESYAYDPSGNRIDSGWVVGPDNRLLLDGTYRYDYDAEGNRTARYIDADGSQSLSAGDTDVTAYAWDTRGRLVRVTDFDRAGGLATQIVDYLYATDDRWIGEDVDLDADGQIDHQTRFVYDDGQIVLQFDRDGEGPVTADDLSHRYLWQPDVADQLIADEQVTNVNEAGQVVWALTDHLGTVRDFAVNDDATGVTTVVNHRTFNSFGRLTSATDPATNRAAAIDCLFAYTGRPTDALTGLQDNWHRKYDPATTAWLSKDPITFIGGDANTRRYVGNSPTNRTDPTGLEWDTETVLYLLAEGGSSLGALWAKKGIIYGTAWDLPWYDYWTGNGPSVTVTYADNKHGTLSLQNPVVRITARVPNDWTSLEVARFIAEEIASDGKLQTTLRRTSLAVSDADMDIAVGRIAEWQAACESIADKLKTGVRIGVSFIPGGLAVLLINDVAEGDFADALLDAVPFIPAGKIGTAALTFVFKTGGTAKKVTVAAPVVKFISEMGDAEKATLKLQLTGKTAEEAQGFLSRIGPGALRGAGFFENLARQATRNPNSTKVVIGKFSEAGQSYQKVAASLKATYFKLENWRELSQRLTRKELVQVNIAFLDQQIGAGKQILLSTDPAVASGLFKDEVQYLVDLGYHFVKDGWVWRAVR